MVLEQLLDPPEGGCALAMCFFLIEGGGNAEGELHETLSELMDLPRGL